MSDSRPATRRALEEALAAIWVEILGGADDDGAGSATRAEPADFLALGGSSLDAFRVAGRIADRLGCAIPLSFLLRHPTLADLVDTVAERLSTAEPKELSASPWRLARDRPLPASAPQRQLWYLDRLHRPTTRTGSLGADPSYNMAITVRFDAPLDPTALQHALDEIVRRHEVLRTRIVERDDTPWQIIDPPRAVTIERVDVTAETPTERRSHALRQAEGLLRQPFDLARDLMLRAAILRLDADDHLVVLMMHHIASDGWSFGILLRELAVLYPHCRQDVAAQSPLPPLELQYADLAHWQEEALSGHRLEQLIDFWRDTLAAPPRALDLPTDHPRAAIPSDGGANFDFAFADGQHTALQALAQRHEATLFMLLASAFAALLYRTSGQKDLLLSVPTAQRLHPASEPLIGFFTNMLVVRARWHGEPSFATLLGQVREACLASFAHQDLPFDRLVEALRPDRQLGRTPFVQTGFALQDTFEIEADFEGLTTEPFPLHSGVSRFDLSLSLHATRQGFRGSAEYRVDLFDPTTIRRWMASFETLTLAALEDPATSIDDLPILPRGARHQLLAEWNASHRPFDLRHCVHHWVHQQAARSPNAPCVRFAGRSLTYRQLEHRAAGLALELLGLGIGVGDTVGVLLERSFELPVALLAVLEAGGVCVPLDPDLPGERLDLLLTDTGARVVVTRADLRDRLPGAYRGMVLEAEAVDTETLDEVGLDPSTFEAPHVDPQDLAYIIYTSGSTGRPKGVRMHHRGLCNRLFWQQDAFPLTPSDRILQNFSIGFDAAFWQFFGPWIAGACSVLPRPGGHMDTAYLAQLMAEEGITCADFVPSVLAPLAEEPAFEDCTALRQVISGGETLHRTLVRDLLQRRPDLRLINLYGPTETSLTISTAPCRMDQDEPTVAVGRPIANTRAYLLDRRGHPVTLGLAGEIHATGEGITQGYLGRPARTAESFLPDPWGAAGARRYRTGDLARLRAGGEIDFIGRTDNQVKIRGVRIELGEVEAKLRQLEGVQEAAAMARDDVPGATAGEKRLVAYLAVGEPRPTVAALRQQVERRLPRAMAPSRYVLLDTLPLSINGKVDRAALPAPAADNEAAQTIQPRDQLEWELAQLWRRVLNLGEVSIRDHFFELGGHSLLAVKLMSQVQQRFGAELELADLYAHGTVEAMANFLRSRTKSRPTGRLVELRSGDGTPLFCVHAIDGTAHAYGPLAQAFHDLGPIYALQAPSAQEAAKVLERFEDLAAYHIATLTAARPKGPVHLCGWSVGGLLASEMARQLEAAGRPVTSLILVDTHPGTARADATRDPATQRAMFAQLTAGLSPPAAVVDAADDQQFLQRLQAHAVEQGRLLHDRRLPALQRHWRVFCALVRASHTYRPEPHDSPIDLIQTSFTPAPLAAEQQRDCQRLTRGGLTTHRVAGDHHSILQPPAVRATAERIEEILRGS